MEIIVLIAAMVVVGLVMGYVAGLIWKIDRPMDVQGTYIVGVITAIVVGLLDWYVIPAMGFSETLKYIGVALEPALAVPIVLWVIKKAKSQ
ncbi:MAG: hypothetical protein E4G99_00410 [Anaerolineales bacterium]|nr:MAG: hypothetical protein E4G99_00410 [Anaerolineales bacterium]